MPGPRAWRSRWLPAVSTIFTAQGSYDLSSTQYGLMFVPQVITAVTTALAGAGAGVGASQARTAVLGRQARRARIRQPQHRG